ncbi:hypothetical protein SDC9_181638 [bioreactor metagenome]|uniref:Uncharacterized protein n=1 Tax=bioreactor metagenome TaxID=1076179 RepID=A0A645H568_9ZZZZ
MFVDLKQLFCVLFEVWIPFTALVYALLVGQLEPEDILQFRGAAIACTDMVRTATETAAANLNFFI